MGLRRQTRGIYGDGKSEGNSPGTIDDIHHIIDGNAALCYVRGYDHLIRKTAVRGRGDKGVWHLGDALRDRGKDPPLVLTGNHRVAGK